MDERHPWFRQHIRDSDVSGKALVGNYYRKIVNVQQTQSIFSTTSMSEHGRYPHRTVRHNQVFPDYTLETITTFQDGGPVTGLGSTSQTQVRWNRRGVLGAGVCGVVHREVQCDGADIIKSRAVKILRKPQLQHWKIDCKKELDALIRLSQVRDLPRRPRLNLVNCLSSLNIFICSSSFTRGTNIRARSL